MRQFLFGLSISVAFIVGCVTAQHVPQLGVPTASAYAGPAWQYTCRDDPKVRVGESWDDVYGAFLNEMGAAGWEVAPIPDGMGSNLRYGLCFKRPA